MCDLHGIYVDQNYLVHILTAKDTIVFSDHNGKIIDYFSIDKDLNIKKDKKFLKMIGDFYQNNLKEAQAIFILIMFNYLIMKFG